MHKLTATERLRELLDERGVKHTDPAEWLTYWDDTNGHVWSAGEMSTGLLNVSTAGVGCLTSEQAIAATLGADASPTQAESSGTLTAEKVRELMEENSRQYPSPTDPYVWLTEYDWQAIADELNATLGAGTCRDIALEGEWFECSECRTVKQLIHPNYCPKCGAKVVGE